MKAKIRALLGQLGDFSARPDPLQDGTDLHEAGLSSYGTVELMVALEGEFGVEFPDHLLTRATFASINSVADAVASLLGEDALTGAGAAR